MAGPPADRVVEVIVQTIAGTSQHVTVHGGPLGAPKSGGGGPHADSPASQTPALTHLPMDTRVQGVGPGQRLLLPLDLHTLVNNSWQPHAGARTLFLYSVSDFPPCSQL